MIAADRLIHLLADCNYLPGEWDKGFVHDMERKLSAPTFDVTEKQLAQLHRIAWRKRKQLAVANFFPPETWRDDSEQKRASTKDQIKLMLWKKNVEKK